VVPVVILLTAACSAPVAPAAIPAALTAETARFEVPAAPGPVKPFRGESTQQVQVVDGYATMLFTLRNVGEEPVTFLNSLYDYEPKQQTAVILYYLHGYSLAESAEIADCHVGTMKSRLHYALKALRSLLPAERRAGAPSSVRLAVDDLP
jgi:DNA-directed RNA polymerase specialized sigma24 family protein